MLIVQCEGTVQLLRSIRIYHNIKIHFKEAV